MTTKKTKDAEGEPEAQAERVQEPDIEPQNKSYWVQNCGFFFTVAPETVSAAIGDKGEDELVSKAEVDKAIETFMSREIK